MKLRNLGPNQTQLHLTYEGLEYVVLFSYDTPVAALIGPTYYRTSKKHSVTTSRHINKWLGTVKAEEKPQEFFDNLISDK